MGTDQLCAVQPSDLMRIHDLTLAKFSLEKSLRHVAERGERTVFEWVNRELKVFCSKYARDPLLSNEILRIMDSIDRRDPRSLKSSLENSLRLVDQELERLYGETRKKS